MTGISSCDLRKLLDYDPETGALTWKPRPVSMFSAGDQSAEHNAAAWNGRYAGKRAFTAVNGRGYLTGKMALASMFDDIHEGTA